MIIFGSLLGLVLLAIGVPIFAFFAITGALILNSYLDVAWYAMGSTMFTSVSKYMLVAIPLFIFAGNLMLTGGIARRLVTAFVAFVGHYRGGLAIAAILSVAVFSAISGSILASIVTIGTIMIPDMEKEGYSKAFAGALIAAVAGIDSLIPPSNAAIIYCSVTGQSVADVFMAGMIPGLVQGFLILLVVVVVCRKMPRRSPFSWDERGKAVYRAIPALSLPAVILGGIYSGLFLPTEAAAVACVLCALIGFAVYQELTLRKMWEALVSTAKVSCVILIIVSTASLLSQVMIYTRTPQMIAEEIIGFGMSPLAFLFLACLTALILGTFLEAIPNMLISMPIFMVVGAKLGVNMLHFYVPFSIFVGIGLLTPPVAVGAYTAASVAKESPANIFRELYPWFVLACVGSGILNIFIPQLATWLPSTMH